MSKNQGKAKLVDGPISQILVRMTIPMVFGMISIVLFNLVDTLYIGRLGTVPLAAMSFTFPIVSLVHSISAGIGMGTSAVVAQVIGKGDHDQVQKLTTSSLLLAFLTVLVIALFGNFFIDPIFSLLGASPDILVLIKQYMRIWFIGMVFLVVPMVGNSAIRSTGDTKTPAMIMMLSAAVNLVLDPLFIFGLGPFPRLELQGAAIATLLSWMITFVGSLWVLGKREQMIAFKHLTKDVILSSWKKILGVGLPAAGNNLIAPISMSIITSIMASYGVVAVAALGVGTRIEFFSMMIVMSLSTTLMPVIGQNWGAKKHDRVKEAFSKSTLFAFVWGFVVLALFLIFGRTIAGFFNSDPEFIRVASAYFWIVPISYGLQGVGLLVVSTLNAIYKPMHAVALNAFRMIGLYVPLAFIGSAYFGIKGIFWGACIANVVVGIIAFIWVRRILFVDTISNPEIA